MSTALLTPDAEHLFNRCAFFSREPIAGELLLEDAARSATPAGLGEFLSSSPRFRAAADDPGCPCEGDGARDQIQMHRVVQAVTRGQLHERLHDAFLAYRAAADTLLAESNRVAWDWAANDATYDLSLQHLESDRSFLYTGNPALRSLIIHQVRRLQLRKPYRGDPVRAGRPPGVAGAVGLENLEVLTLAVEVAIAMRSGRPRR